MFELFMCHFLARSRILVGAAMLSCLLAANVYAHGVTLKYQDAEPANTAFATGFLQSWANKIHEDSRGRINLLIEPKQSASANANLLKSVIDRSADIVWLRLQGPANSHPRFEVFGTALGGSTSAGSSQALWSWVDANDLGFREFKDMRILAAVRHDAPLFHMRANALSTVTDLKGAKIAIPTSDGATFLSKLGAIPLVVPEENMADALAQSRVDGVLLSWSSLAALKLEPLLKAHSAAPQGAPWPYAELSVLLMNPDAYRGLADDLKQTMRANSGNDVSASIGKTLDETAVAARKYAAERGDTVSVLPQGDLESWRNATNAELSERITALDKLGLKGKKLISRAQALVVEYDSVP